MLENTEEVEIKNPNYFIITNADPIFYDVKYFTANYNGVFANSINNWNFNYFWKYQFVKPYIQDSNLYKNKYQYVGQFPDAHTYKDGLTQFFQKFKKKFPKDYDYLPESFIYPSQKKLIDSKFHSYIYDPKDVWLFKPARSLCAQGIQILEDYQQIKKAKYKYYLISRYIMNPMLIKNKKFDMRAYVLVTGMNPLKVYFYRDGYLKIPVNNYTLEYSHIRDGCVHITTSDTKGKEYKYDTDIYDENSNFWSYLFFERYCQRYGINYTDIIEQIKDISIKTFLSLKDDFEPITKKFHFPDRNKPMYDYPSHFQLLSGIRQFAAYFLYNRKLILLLATAGDLSSTSFQSSMHHRLLHSRTCEKPFPPL